MTSVDRESLLDELRRAGPQTPGSSNDDRELDALADTADRLWLAMQSAPPLEQDPVAALLGLVPDPNFTLDRKAFTNARKLRQFKVSDIARRLQRRGWKVADSDVFRWETKSAADVSPALIRAIAEELNVAIEKLSTSAPSDRTSALLSSVKQSSTYAGLVARWAAVQGLPNALAASMLESRIAATVHRGDHPDPDQLLRSLDALVSALEHARPDE